MRFPIYLLLCSFFTALSAAPKSELAHVAILKFSDETGKKDYEWVRTSLPDAINKSMIAKFEFLRTEDGKLSSFGKAIQPADQAYLDEIARQSGSDIIIFGKYGYEGNKDEIVITSYVYHQQGRKIIGESKVTSKLDGTLFGQIDKIAAKSVENIYQFVLSVSKEGKTTKVAHVLVLVPTWSNTTEQTAAEKEIQGMKSSLVEKYHAQFVTLNEFYSQAKIPESETKTVNNYALHRDKEKIIAWLGTKGIDNAFIIFVADKKVSITPVAEGASQEEFSYPVAAKPAEKLKAIEQNTQKAGIELNTTATTRLRRDLLAQQNHSALHVLGYVAFQAGPAANYIAGGIGFKAAYRRNFLKPWFYPIVQASFLRTDGKNDPDFGTTFFAGSAGAGYPVFSFGKLSVFTYGTLGATAAMLRSQSKTYIHPYFEAGALMDYEIVSRILLTLNLSGGFVADSNRPAITVGMLAGAGYRF